MVETFKENQILLLFIVIAVGYGIGSIKVRGSGLGVAAVLFVGLAFGSLSPDLYLPEFIIFMGLAIFVYTIGLTSGPSFFNTFRRRGSRDLIFIFAMQAFSALVALGLHFLFHFDAATTSGVYAGSSTNTPALAGLLDAISNASLEEAMKKGMSEAGVIGYSISYPMGVLGSMIAITVLQRVLRIDYSAEESSFRKLYPLRQQIKTRVIQVQQVEATGIPLRDLRLKNQWTAIFGRVQRDGEVSLVNWDTTFKVGDEIAVVGDQHEVDEIAKVLGVTLDRDIPFEKTDYQPHQVFVSNPDIAGQQIATLNLWERFPAVITRIIRGDNDMLATSEMVLELGDRVRIIARREDLPAILRLFGDSYYALSQINLLSFGLGMGLGLLLGMITFQLPGDVNFKLGYAGGPLIVALVLGSLRRTGPIVWTLPYGANLTLRQVGLIFLLAGIGVNSGHTFKETISGGGGGYIFLASSIIALSAAFVTLLVGYKIMRLPFGMLTGVVANQPAILDFALDKAKNQMPVIGYTLVLPIAIVSKIVFVQILFALLR